MKVVITSVSNDDETLGTLQVLDDSGKQVYICKTLELPNKNNAPDISCIPRNKEYQCTKVGATEKIPYPHITVGNVPNRKGICIHIGNYAGSKNPSTGKSDILGCILVGKSHQDINKDGIEDITTSTQTFKELMEALPISFKLQIGPCSISKSLLTNVLR